MDPGRVRGGLGSFGGGLGRFRDGFGGVGDGLVIWAFLISGRLATNKKNQKTYAGDIYVSPFHGTSPVLFCYKRSLLRWRIIVMHPIFLTVISRDQQGKGGRRGLHFSRFRFRFNGVLLKTILAGWILVNKISFKNW
jgi:hypothetical protein